MSTQFPVIGVTAEDLIRASPQWAFTPAPAPAANEENPTSRFRSGRSTTTRDSGGGTTIDAGGSRFRSSSGNSQGRAFIQLTRATSAEIRRGRNPQKNSAQMASAARSTRNFFASTRKTGSTRNLEKNRNIIASSARKLVSISAGSTASRSTSVGILNSIRAMPPRTNGGTGTGTGNPGGGVSRRDREAIGQRLKDVVEAHMANIRSSLTRAEELRKEMNRLIGERDFVVQKLSVEIIDKAPVKIADKVMSAQQKLLNLDSQLGALKAEYDVYDSSVREQSMFINRVLTFGPEAVDTGTLPPVSAYPTNFPSGLRGQGSTGAFFKFFQVPDAWATDAKDPAMHWLNEWERFSEEYRDYSLSLEKNEEKNRMAVASFLGERKKRVEENPMEWMDTETLVAAKMFMSELLEESSYLVNQGANQSLALDSVTLQNLKDSSSESQEALAEVMGLTQELLKAAPQSYADNPEVWLGMLPDILLF
jgi:hypothetical protein